MLENGSTNFKKFLRFLEDSTESLKAPLPAMHLALLNSLTDAYLAKVVGVLFGNKYVRKCSATYLGVSDWRSVRLNQYYGHLVIGEGDAFVRLSTCLDKDKRSVQIPVSEKAYWNDKTYLLFTTGDLFILVKTSDIEKCAHVETLLKNYEYSIPDLFIYGLVSDFGIVDSNQVLRTSKNGFTDLKFLKNTKGLNTYKLKSCINTFRPKYALQVVNGNKFCEYYTTIEGVFKQHQDVSVTPQYLNRLAKLNAEMLVDEMTYNKDNTDDFWRRGKMITIDGTEYMIVSLKNLSIENYLEIVELCDHRRCVREREDYLARDKEISPQEAFDYILKTYGIKANNIEVVKDVFQRYSLNTCDMAVGINQVHGAKCG